MFWLGLLLPVVFIPGWTGASIETQWSLLSATLPVMTLFRRGPVGYAHLLGIFFISYAALSMTWTINRTDSVMGLWFVSIWAMSFWLGSTSQSLSSMWKGLAIGMTVSSGVAILQAFGYQPVLVDGINRGFICAGLLYNTTVSGSVAALVIIGLISHRLWFYIPGVLPSLIPGVFPSLHLSQSRGALLVLITAMIARYVNWKIAAVVLLAAFLMLTLHPNDSDALRLMLWRISFQNLSWLGHGPGTLVHAWITYHDTVLRSEYTHNDYLQLGFEHGIGAIAVFAIILAALAQKGSRDWPVFVTFAGLMLFWFPLFSPVPAFIGCVVAGHVLRDWHLVGRHGCCGRPDLVPGHPEPGPALVRRGAQGIPVELQA